VIAISIAGISAIIAITALCSSVAARGQGPSQLMAGFNQERSLGPGENHAYVVRLTEGMIRIVDRPNGTGGPEPIDLTAITRGHHKLVIHTLDSTTKPGQIPDED
jgi:hypothetical protein